MSDVALIIGKMIAFIFIVCAVVPIAIYIVLAIMGVCYTLLTNGQLMPGQVGTPTLWKETRVAMNRVGIKPTSYYK